jgi:LysM repeat protein
MYKKLVLLALGFFLVFIITGCAVKTYVVTKDRLDQDLSQGNRGYLLGEAEVTDEEPRKTTRKLRIVEFELYPIKFGQKSSAPVSQAKVSARVSVPESSIKPEETPEIEPVRARPDKPSWLTVMKRYTVRRGDTLQSISKKFYGTTKRWKEIYKLNQDALKNPNDIYPGQVIKIFVEETVGTK